MPKDKSFSCLVWALCVSVSAAEIAALTLFLFVFMIGTLAVKAQESVTRNEFWPEIDVYVNVKPKVRIYLIGTVSKSVEDGEIRNAQSFERRSERTWITFRLVISSCALVIVSGPPWETLIHLIKSTEY